MPHLTPEQTAHVKAAQIGLRKAKDGLRDGMTAMTAMMDAAKAAGDFVQHNAAFEAREYLRACLASVGIAHAKMSASLVQHFPEDAPDIIIQGPGR